MKNEKMNLKNDDLLEDGKMDFERKVEIKNELENCKKELDEVLSELMSSQKEFEQWIHDKKDIVNCMRSHALNIGEKDDILSFADYRNSFLINKTNQVNRYIDYINKSLALIDSLDLISLEEIDTNLRLMFVSLGLTLKTKIFGEPF